MSWMRSPRLSTCSRIRAIRCSTAPFVGESTSEVGRSCDLNEQCRGGTIGRRQRERGNDSADGEQDDEAERAHNSAAAKDHRADS